MKKFLVTLACTMAVVVIGGLALPALIGVQQADRLVLWFLVGLVISHFVGYLWDKAHDER